VEDQPTDPGDLTTDPAAAPEAPDPRGRHRMPRGKVRRALTADPDDAQVAPEADEATIEEPPAAVELTSSAAEESTAKPRQRWNPLRRKKNQSEVAATEDAAAEEPADDPPATDGGSEATSDDERVAEAPSEETEGETTEAAGATEDEPVLVPHQPAGRRLKIAAAAAAVLFVAGGAFLGASAQPVLANRALVETKLNIARTAANAITTLWSYTPENMDSLADRSVRYLGGDFAFQYRKFIDSIVATNKQAQVTNTTSVLGTAVESVSPSEASAVVYTNSVATSPVSKNIPSLRYLSYRLEMKRDHADWRITRMTTVTTLDLTPQL
jgi:Mce-associated membrane protein